MTSRLEKIKIKNIRTNIMGSREKELPSLQQSQYQGHFPSICIVSAAYSPKQQKFIHADFRTQNRNQKNKLSQ